MALRKTVIASALTCLLLTACGGGGKDISGTGTTTNSSSSNSGSTSTTTGTYKLELSLKTCTDISTLSTCKEQTTTPATLPADKPNLVEVTLLDDKSKPVAGAVVDISTSEYAVGSIQGATRALTDATGKARFVLIANASNGNQVGKVGITATYTSSSGTAGTLTQSKTFEFGALDLSMEVTSNTSELALNSTATITAKVFSNGELYTSPLSVSFTSICASNSSATLDTSVTSSGGIALATYKGTYSASGATSICGVTDTVTASVNGLSKTVQIKNIPTIAKTITATKPATSFIFTQGNGNTDNVNLTFTVTDEYGYPKASENVKFELEGVSNLLSEFASYTLSQTEASTNENGTVSVNVKAGAIPSPFRVSAYLANNSAVRAPSQQIAVGMGLPDADSFSFSADKYSIEGANTDGKTATITIRLADRYNNPVPNGTKVYFTTEGGNIRGTLSDGSAGATGYCETTSNGECTATLTSAAPRPADGRVTVMAYVVGEESYKDLDGTKTFTPGDIAGVDIDEPYRDDNGDGSFTSGIDTPWERNGDQAHNVGNGKYDGILCSSAAESANLCTSKTVNIYLNREFVFSGLTSTMDASGTGSRGEIAIQKCTVAGVASSCSNTSSIDLTSGTVYMRFQPASVAYKNGVKLAENAIPSGSTMKIENTNGGAISACCGGSDYTGAYPETWTKADWFWFEIKPEETANGKTSGELKVIVTSPDQKVLTSSPIAVTDAS